MLLKILIPFGLAKSHFGVTFFNTACCRNTFVQQKIITMRTFSMLTILLLISCSLLAQTTTNRFSGSVADSLSKQPLPNATVKIKNSLDTTITAITTTDTKGFFVFKAVKAGNYNMVINYVGYKPLVLKNIPVDESAKPLSIQLGLEAKGLNAVTVTAAAKPFITVTADKVTLNVASSPVAAGGNAYDVLLRAPGLIEQSGALSLNGKSVNVLVNGRQSNLTGEDLKTMLTNMPANGIEKVELLSNPSSKYDAQGGSVINIILAKNKNFGTNGSVTAGIGTGRFVKYNTGLTLNYRNKNINVYGGYDFMHNRQYYQSNSFRALNGNTSIVENEYEVRKRDNNSAKIGFDYDINKRSSLGVLVRGFNNVRYRDVTHNTLLDVANAAKDSTSQILTTGKATFFNPSVNVYYKTTLDSAGKKELTINADYFNYKKEWNDDFVTRYYDEKSAEYGLPYLLRDNSPANNTVKSFTADFVATTKFAKWEMGLKTAFTTTDNNILWESMENGNWKNDLNKSNHFIYKENVNAGYINFSKTIKKYSLQLGLRAEQTNTEGNAVTSNVVNKNDYLNVFPNIAVSYNQSATQQFGISYRKSIQRFGFDIVNPFVIYQSQYSYAQGNPNIQPMLMHSVELSHSYKYQIFSKVSYTRMDNSLAPVFKRSLTDSAVISTYDNLGSANVYQANATIVKNFFKGKFGTVNTIGAFYATYNASSYTNQVNAKVTGYISSNNTIGLPGKIKAEIMLFYYSPIATGVFQQKSLFQMNAGFSRPVLNNNATLALNVTDVFNTLESRYDVLYQGGTMNSVNKTETRFVNLVFTYRFGNTKVKASKVRKTGIEDEKGRMNAN